MEKSTTYKLNADGTIKVISGKSTSFKEKLERKYPTPNADKYLKERPETNNFDTHKWLK